MIQQALGDPNFTPFDAETGNYNSFWLVEREIDNRTSLIVDSPAGRIPDLTPEARQQAEARRAYRREHSSDGPEDRGLGDRCLNFATPRMGAGYNSYFQILQAPGYVAILQEMGHQARMNSDRRTSASCRRHPPVERGRTCSMGGRLARHRDHQLLAEEPLQGFYGESASDRKVHAR